MASAREAAAVPIELQMPTAEVVVVVGASAGGVPALVAIARDLPPDFRAAVLVVLHVMPTGHSVLPAILSRAGPLPARHACDGDAIRPGQILVAPPDYQMTVVDGTVSLARGPRENNHRPAIDPLMRTAAGTYRHRAIGVVLTGMLDDGTAGLAAVKAWGGVTVVQDPDTATHPSMPRSARNAVGPDHIVPLDEISPLLERLVTAELDKPKRLEVAMGTNGRSETEVERGDDHGGDLTGFTCPECHGTLWEIEEAGVASFRCRVGHRYSIDTLVASQADSTESALWAAGRALDEKAALNRRVAARLERAGSTTSAQKFERIAEGAEAQSRHIQELISRLERPPRPEEELVAEM